MMKLSPSKKILNPETESRGKKEFMSFEEAKIIKNCPMWGVFPTSKTNDTICYDIIVNKFQNIVKDVCALANSNGGSIFLGINTANRCIGISDQSREHFLEKILKLSRFIFSTVSTASSRKPLYTIKNYIVIVESSQQESFISEIIVEKISEQCVVNFFNVFSSFQRVNNETVTLTMCEELTKVFYEQNENATATIDIGEKYPEDQPIEFKVTLGFLKAKEEGMAKYTSCFANTEGGAIVIGASDTGIVHGIHIENQPEWEKIRCEILRSGNHINNVDFISKIILEKIPLKKKNFFLIKINIPKNTDSTPILTRDRHGNWFKWRKEQNVFVKEEFIISSYDIGDKYDGEECTMMEFKKSLDFLKKKNGVGKYISSFGNTEGGTILVGVQDDAIICGVRIENSQEWDVIKRDILRGQKHINNVDFLSQLKIERIPLKTQNLFIVKIDIPKNTSAEPILVRDSFGTWDKWSRVLSSSVKDNRVIMYTQDELRKVEDGYVMSQILCDQLTKENERLRNKSNDVTIEIDKVKKSLNENQAILNEYVSNMVYKFENLQRKKYDLSYLATYFPIFGLITICLLRITNEFYNVYHIF